MPDVEVRYQPNLRNHTNGKFGDSSSQVTVETVFDLLRQEVAKQMDCLDDNGEMIVHDPYKQIAIPVFEPITGTSRRPLLITVIAYDWPDRMRNIEERLERVGERVRRACGLAEDSIALTFIPLPRGPYPGGCWVAI